MFLRSTKHNKNLTPRSGTNSLFIGAMYRMWYHRKHITRHRSQSKVTTEEHYGLRKAVFSARSTPLKDHLLSLLLP